MPASFLQPCFSILKICPLSYTLYRFTDFVSPNLLGFPLFLLRLHSAILLIRLFWALRTSRTTPIFLSLICSITLLSVFILLLISSLVIRCAIVIPQRLLQYSIFVVEIFLSFFLLITYIYAAYVIKLWAMVWYIYFVVLSNVLPHIMLCNCLIPELVCPSVFLFLLPLYPVRLMRIPDTWICLLL